MEFVKKHFTKIILCIGIALCWFVKFVSFKGEPYYALGMPSGVTLTIDSYTLTELVKYVSFFIGSLPVCMLGTLICEFMHKRRGSFVLSLVGLICLFITPGVVLREMADLNDFLKVEKHIYSYYGELNKLKVSPSFGYIVMLICFILLIIISIIRFLTSNSSEIQEANSTTTENADEAEAGDSSKVNLNK